RVSGISIGWTLFKAMVISGAAAGFAGSLHLMGVLYRMDAGYAETGFGYISIAVAMLGAAHPIGIIFSSLFFSYLMIGAQNMQRMIQIPFPLVYAVIGCMLISLTVVQKTYRRWV
ncbi:MAG: ABC transporter permease, partial [Nitrososphaerota archaeon]